MPGVELYASAGAAGTLAGVALGLFHPRVPLFGPVVWRGPSARSAVALTFDDGPDPSHTSRIASILNAQQVAATFFCVGEQVKLHRPVARLLVGSGHQLENHTYRHGVGRDLFSSSRLREDLQRCQDVLEGVTGRVPRYYRPAVGIRSPPVHAAARALGLVVVTWTHAARDGVFALTPPRALALAERASPGAILALHDGHRHGTTGLREQTVQNLPLLLRRLKERGFVFQTLADLLKT